MTQIDGDDLVVVDTDHCCCCLCRLVTTGWWEIASACRRFVNLAMIRRSNVIEINVRFEIGRYEFRSLGSSNGFLSSGCVRALSGSELWSLWLIDALYVLTTTGDKTVLLRKSHCNAVESTIHAVHGWWLQWLRQDTIDDNRRRCIGCWRTDCTDLVVKVQRKSILPTPSVWRRLQQTLELWPQHPAGARNTFLQNLCCELCVFLSVLKCTKMHLSARFARTRWRAPRHI